MRPRPRLPRPRRPSWPSGRPSRPTSWRPSWPGGRPPGPRAWLTGLAVLVAIGVGVTAAVLAGNGSPTTASRRTTAAAQTAPAHSRSSAPAAGTATGPRVPAAVRALADRLPLERRVAQLFVVAAPAGPPSGGLQAALRAHGWGGVLVGGSGNGQVAALAQGVGAASGAGAGGVRPLVVAGQDVPPPLVGPNPGSTPPAKVRRSAADAARALRRLGVTMTLGIDADLGDPSSALAERTFGEDPATVGKVAVAALAGARNAGLIAGIGHFPGQGAASMDPGTAVATVGGALADLRRRDVRPFAAVVAHGAPVIVMSNAVYAAFDGVTPAALLPRAIDGVLRRDLGFRGVVMTDDLAATTLATGTSTGDAAVQALRAGDDLLLVPGDPAAQDAAYRRVLAAARSGAVSRARLREALLRVLALKHDHRLAP